MGFKRIPLLGWVLFFLMVSTYTVYGVLPHQLYVEGINAYNAGNYDAATERFLAIADQGVVNDRLFYNVGNAFFKKGDLGRAIVWYERAFKLAPNDPDLKFNLDFARSQVKDENEIKKNILFRVMFFWNYIFSSKTIQWTALILNGMFWLMLTINAVLKKKTSRPFGWIASAFILIFVSTALYNYYEDKYDQYAVITSEKVSVRSGWTEDATELFALHAGTKVKVDKEQNGFYRIYFSQGKIGWLKKADAEVI